MLKIKLQQFKMVNPLFAIRNYQKKEGINTWQKKTVGFSVKFSSQFFELSVASQ